MRHPYEAWGHLLINILIRHQLAKKMLSFFVVQCYGFSFPSSCMWLPQLQTDRRELSKQTCQLLILSVLVRWDCQKEKALFLKDFQTFNILSFMKSVQEMMLRVEMFTLGEWFSFTEWFSLMVKEGNLGKKRPSRGDQREEASCGVKWLVGRVGRCCCFFAFFFEKETCFPKSYSGQKPQCTLCQLVQPCEGRIRNISSKPPAVDGGWRTMEDIIFQLGLHHV